MSITRTRTEKVKSCGMAVLAICLSVGVMGSACFLDHGLVARSAQSGDAQRVQSAIEAARDALNAGADGVDPASADRWAASRAAVRNLGEAFLGGEALKDQAARDPRVASAVESFREQLALLTFHIEPRHATGDLDACVRDFDRVVLLCRQAADERELRTVRLTEGLAVALLAVLGAALIRRRRNRRDDEWGLTAGMALEFAGHQEVKQTLRQSEERLEAIFQAMPDAAFIFDEKGRYVEVLSGAKNGLLYDAAGDVRGRLVQKVFPGEDGRRFAEVIRRTVETGEDQTFEYELEVPAGTRWFDARTTLLRNASGVAPGVLFIARDITERKTADAALRKSEERLWLALEVATDGLWDYRVDGEELYLSPRFYTMLGYEPYALPQQVKVWRNLIHEDDARGLEDDIGGQVMEQGDRYDAEFRMRDSDGGWRWIHSQGIVVGRDDDGVPLRLVGTHTDITRRRQAEEQRHVFEEGMRQAQKMEAIGTLAGGIAHDINNVLAIIIGYGELVATNLTEGTRERDNIEQVLKAGDRAKQLVRQILTFSRRADSERKPVELHLILNETLKMMRSSIPSTVEIIQDIDEDAGTVFADSTQLHQIIMNLCTNAFQAIGEQEGTITVSLHSVSLGADMAETRPGLRPGRYLELAVRDTGEGIDAEARARIFDPFFTTKGVGKGTGLGLATVHGIVTGLDGAVFVDSLPGEGATFTVLLPSMSACRSDAPLAEGPLPRGEGQHILLVDDEPDILESLRQVLEGLGYTVHTCVDSEAALELFWHEGKHFDLVITDQIMPHLTGAQLASALAELVPRMPVILTTGYSEQVDECRVQELGISGFLSKPYSMREIAVAVDQVLRAA